MWIRAIAAGLLVASELSASGAPDRLHKGPWFRK